MLNWKIFKVPHGRIGIKNENLGGLKKKTSKIAPKKTTCLRGAKISPFEKRKTQSFFIVFERVMFQNQPKKKGAILLMLQKSCTSFFCYFISLFVGFGCCRMFFFNQSYGKPCQKWLMLYRIVAHPAGLLKEPLLHPKVGLGILKTACYNSYHQMSHEKKKRPYVPLYRLFDRDPYNGSL